MFIITQGEEGTPVAEICHQAGISQATYFDWKKAVFRFDADRDEAAQAFQGRDCPAKADRGGPVAGPQDAAGCHPAKARSQVGLNQWCPLAHPGSMRELIRGMCSGWLVSRWQVCPSRRDGRYLSGLKTLVQLAKSSEIADKMQAG